MNNLYENIKAIRSAKGLKQKEVAELLQISPQGYQKLESGENDITFSRLQQIAEVFGMSVTEVINYTNNITANVEDRLIEKLDALENRLNQLERSSKGDLFDDKKIVFLTASKEQTKKMYKFFLKLSEYQNKGLSELDNSKILQDENITEDEIIGFINTLEWYNNFIESDEFSTMFKNFEMLKNSQIKEENGNIKRNTNQS